MPQPWKLNQYFFAEDGNGNFEFRINNKMQNRRSNVGKKTTAVHVSKVCIFILYTSFSEYVFVFTC